MYAAYNSCCGDAVQLSKQTTCSEIECISHLLSFDDWRSPQKMTALSRQRENMFSMSLVFCSSSALFSCFDYCVFIAMQITVNSHPSMQLERISDRLTKSTYSESVSWSQSSEKLTACLSVVERVTTPYTDSGGCTLSTARMQVRRSTVYWQQSLMHAN